VTHKFERKIKRKLILLFFPLPKAKTTVYVKFFSILLLMKCYFVDYTFGVFQVSTLKKALKSLPFVFFKKNFFENLPY